MVRALHGRGPDPGPNPSHWFAPGFDMGCPKSHVAGFPGRTIREGIQTILYPVEVWWRRFWGDQRLVV